MKEEGSFMDRLHSVNYSRFFVHFVLPVCIAISALCCLGCLCLFIWTSCSPACPSCCATRNKHRRVHVDEDDEEYYERGAPYSTNRDAIPRRYYGKRQFAHLRRADSHSLAGGSTQRRQYDPFPVSLVPEVVTARRLLDDPEQQRVTSPVNPDHRPVAYI